MTGGWKVRLKIADKKAIVAEVNEVASKASSVALADYRGLTVAEMTDLRAKARSNNSYRNPFK